MLSMTKAELGLISDAEIYLLFGKFMRGEVSFISKTYSKASSKYLESYDPKQE